MKNIAIPKVSQSPSVYSCNLDQDVIVFHPIDQEYIRLAATAACIWNFLAVPRSVDEVVSHLCERYDITMHACQSEVEIFLSDLSSGGFLDNQLVGESLG